MGSIFKPKMPALPPVQPAPEPPSSELSAEEKEAIAKEQAAIEKIQNTDLKNQIGYIARIQENQSHLLLNIETNKGNTIVTNDKLKTMEQKINEMEKDFKNFLIMRSTLTGEK